MAIPKLPKDAKRLALDHRELLNNLKALTPMAQTFRAAVQSGTEAVIDWEVQRILGEIPVEELNRNKRGIRVKTLRDAGYETVADLTKADVRRLTALNGISPEGAAEIHGIVGELAAQARQGIRIRITADRKTPEASALLLALLQVQGADPLAQTAIRLLNGEGRRIQGAIAALEPAKSGLSWLFASGEKKHRAHEGYRILCEPQFKPSIENQAISRAYRMGQTRNVLVYRLLCEDTVDERILEILAAKQQAFDAFADDSAVARESLELDQKGFGAIMEAEKQRIEAPYALAVR